MLPERFSRAEALGCWQSLLSNHASTLWGTLVDEEVIVPDCSWPIDVWARDGWWEAALFHQGTRDYPFLAMDAPGAAELDDARMAAYIAETPPPPRTLTKIGSDSFPLPRLPQVGQDDWVTALSPSERRGLPGIGALFDLCGGIRRNISFAVQGEFLGKAVPSGGARHPTELFLASFALEGLPAGVYHYNAAGHCLRQVRPLANTEDWRHATFDLFKKWRQAPCAVVVFAVLWERAMWRYRDDRSARAPLIDVGHVVMAFREVSEKLGFGHYTYQKFGDGEIARLCDIDLLRLTPLYVATLI